MKPQEGKHSSTVFRSGLLPVVPSHGCPVPVTDGGAACEEWTQSDPTMGVHMLRAAVLVLR